MVSSTGEMCFSLSPFAPKKLVSRGRFCRSVLHQPPLILHSQAESGVQQSCKLRVWSGGLDAFMFSRKQMETSLGQEVTGV